MLELENACPNVFQKTRKDVYIWVLGPNAPIRINRFAKIRRVIAELFV